jgi:5-methylcytosine-specific restriction endonuclease McrA
MNYKGVKDQVFECVNCGTTIAYKGPSYRHKYCSLSCSATGRKTEKAATVATQFAEGQLTARRNIYKLLVERDGDKCSVCGIEHWNSKPIRLWVDHIDGDATNNTPSNFRLICPNCDSQSETFGAKNRGQGRKSKGLPSYG